MYLYFYFVLKNRSYLYLYMQFCQNRYIYLYLYWIILFDSVSACHVSRYQAATYIWLLWQVLLLVCIFGYAQRLCKLVCLWVSGHYSDRRSEYSTGCDFVVIFYNQAWKRSNRHRALFCSKYQKRWNCNRICSAGIFGPCEKRNWSMNKAFLFCYFCRT